MIPGGQYSNLIPAGALPCTEEEFENHQKNYQIANDLFGDIVKVTPSSKVVGDMAMFMTSTTCPRRISCEVIFSSPTASKRADAGRPGYDWRVSHRYPEDGALDEKAPTPSAPTPTWSRLILKRNSLPAGIWRPPGFQNFPSTNYIRKQQRLPEHHMKILGDPRSCPALLSFGLKIQSKRSSSAWPWQEPAHQVPQ